MTSQALFYATPIFLHKILMASPFCHTFELASIGNLLVELRPSLGTLPDCFIINSSFAAGENFEILMLDKLISMGITASDPYVSE